MRVNGGDGEADKTRSVYVKGGVGDGEADKTRSVYVEGVEVMVRLTRQEVCVCM